MRLSNKHKTGIYSFVNTIILLIFIGGVAAFFFNKIQFQILGWESIIFLIIPFILISIIYARGRQIFEYDSDGEALNFKNRNIIPFLDKPANDEFPKYKLMKYEIVDALFFRKLYITISSKKEHNSTILKYDISYLSKKEVHDLKISLNKVVKANKEIKSQTSDKI